MRKIRRIFTALILAVCMSLGGLYLYASDYYRADAEMTEAFLPDVLVEKRDLSDGSIAFIPTEYTVGIIFYPGGKVEYTAYEPLMLALAEKGILTVLVKMPLNLAVLKSGAADGIPEELPGVEKWYMAGHSLGGSMAASYISKNTEKFDGLILLAAYSTADLSGSGIEVASIYGSLDGVMNREKYEEYKSNLPSDLHEVVIDGGNHAGFGMYGEQKNDGIAALTNAEQIGTTADIILEFVGLK